MATRGQIIENPVSGERLKWHLTTADTDGALVRLELWVQPGGGLPAPHVPTGSEERFELIAGRMVLRAGGERRLLERGDRATVPAGVEHTWENPGPGVLHVMAEVEPALDFERLVEVRYAGEEAVR
jgi:mannose-6-phosphate isomerase-like protein (cupin superfamily)